MSQPDFLHLIFLFPAFFYSFLATKDIVAFDSACLSGVKREQFLASLANTQLPQLTCSTSCMDWILRRKVLPGRITIGKFMTETDAILLSEVTSAVQEIHMADLQGYEHRLKITCLQSLVHVSFTACSPFDFGQSALQLCRLQHLEVHYMRGNCDASVLACVTHCTQLRSLHITQGARCKDKRIVLAIQRNCPRLNNCILYNCTGEVIKALFALQAARAQTKVHSIFTRATILAAARKNAGGTSETLSTTDRDAMSECLDVFDWELSEEHFLLLNTLKPGDFRGHDPDRPVIDKG